VTRFLPASLPPGRSGPAQAPEGDHGLESSGAFEVPDKKLDNVIKPLITF
jgi:hypothetical protein